MSARALLMALLLAPAGLWAADVDIPDFRARYTLEKAGLDVVSTVITLKRGGDRIEYRAESEPVGLASWLFGDHRIHELSVLQQVEEQVIPLEYRYIHEGSDENRNEHYQYHWTRNVAQVYYRGAEKTLRIPEGTLDNSSLQLALIHDAGRDTPTTRHPVISRGELKTYTFRNLGTETIEAPLGRFETVKLQRRKDDEENTTYTTWYAPKLNYLPVKVENRENGKIVLSLSLEELEWL
jgi:hypothetical protein